jgi:hypothetical protein
MAEEMKDQISVTVKDEFDYSEYDVIKTEIPVKFKDKHYVLREASGKAARIYRNASLACIVLGPEGKPSMIRNLANVEPLLVSLCLWEKPNPEASAVKPVTQDFVETMPSKLQKRLYAKAKEISDLDEEPDTKTQLIEAMKLPDAPVSLDDLRKFIAELPDDDGKYKQLKAWIKPTAEDKAKNAPSDMTVG